MWIDRRGLPADTATCTRLAVTEQGGRRAGTLRVGGRPNPDRAGRFDSVVRITTTDVLTVVKNTLYARRVVCECTCLNQIIFT